MGYIEEMWEDRIERLLDTRNITDLSSLQEELSKLPTTKNGKDYSKQVQSLLNNSDKIFNITPVQDTVIVNISRPIIKEIEEETDAEEVREIEIPKVLPKQKRMQLGSKRAFRNRQLVFSKSFDEITKEDLESTRQFTDLQIAVKWDVSVEEAQAKKRELRL